MARAKWAKSAPDPVHAELVEALPCSSCGSPSQKKERQPFDKLRVDGFGWRFRLAPIRSKWLRATLLAFALAGCGPSSLPAHPALWRIDGPHGQRGWLFGTIHMLPRPLDWRTPVVAAALAQSDRLVVEIAALNDNTAGANRFAALAHGAPQPPLASKIAPALHPKLAQLMQRGDLRPAQFADVKTWAAALMLAQAAETSGASGAQAKWGIDRALLRDNAKPVTELEGTARQLGLFDSLPEPVQRALLAAVVADADHAATDTQKLAEEWRKGDMVSIARQTHEGMMADPALRQMLYVGRNQAWAQAIARELAAGIHPFVAVGAAHMAGADGLPALLAGRGFTVTRVE